MTPDYDYEREAETEANRLRAEATRYVDPADVLAYCRSVAPRYCRGCRHRCERYATANEGK